MRKHSLKCYICMILAIALFTGCSVGTTNNKIESTDIESSEITTEEIINTSEVLDSDMEQETESETEIVFDPDLFEKYYEGYLYWDYFTLEEGINQAYYVVEAKCIDTYSDVQDTYAVFETLNNIKGEIKEETFIIRADRRAIVYIDDLYKYKEDYSKQYTIGKEYVLVMNRIISVYNDYDYYTLIGGIHIPKDCLSESYMFGYASLLETAENKDCLNMGYDNFINYIKELVRENPTGTRYNGVDYIRSEKLADIVRETKTILRIKMGYHEVVGMDKNRELCFCTVVDVLKGISTKEEIQVLFPAGVAITDNEYLVMLYNDTEFYLMSSKNSVYCWDDTQKVEKIIELINQPGS